MTKPNKLPPVTSEMAGDWLKRFEEDGESPPQIAKADNFDVRTVRKYLEKAREERDRRQTKQAVLRGALEKHYADLCVLAKKIKTELIKDVPVAISTTLKEEPLFRALQKHLPKSRLWRDIESLSRLKVDYWQSVEELKERIRKEALSGTSLSFVSSADKLGLYDDGFTAGIVGYLQSAALGYQGFAFTKYQISELGEGVRIERGSYALGLVPKENVKAIEDLFDTVMKTALEWAEYGIVLGITEKFVQIKRRIEDELLKIILRRVVPGKCDYCPL